jgi:hypothetical protein
LKLKREKEEKQKVAMNRAGSTIKLDKHARFSTHFEKKKKGRREVNPMHKNSEEEILSVR